MIVSIDPGTYNTGVAIIEGKSIELLNIENKDLAKYIEKLHNQINTIDTIIIGNNKQKKVFESLLSKKPNIVNIVDEYNSTIEARKVCFDYNRKKFRFIKAFATLLSGDHCDGWAALILYSRRSNISPEQILKEYKIKEIDFL